MALLSVMLDRVSDELPSVPEPLALRALSDSFKEFCVRTHIWQEALPTIRARADRTEFELSPDTGAMVVAIKEIRQDGQLIPPVPTELPRILVNTLPSGTRPVAWTQIRPDLIDLVNAPLEDITLTAVAALTLTQGYTDYDIPDVLIDEYAEALAAGAKGRLVVQASQPWYAPDAAPEYRRQFYVAVNQAKRRVMTALGTADMQMQMRSW